MTITPQHPRAKRIVAAAAIGAAALLFFMFWQVRAFWSPDLRSHGLDPVEMGAIAVLLLSSWGLESSLSGMARRRPGPVKRGAVWLGRIALLVIALIS